MKKIILAISLFLLIGSGGVAYYFFGVKHYETADHEVKEITDSEYTLALPVIEQEESESAEVETSTEENKEENIPLDSEQKENPPAPPMEEKHKSVNKEQKETSQTKTETKPKKRTAEDIIGIYRSSFESLESQANEKINTLVGRAIAEYKEKSATGENVQFSYFFQKYKRAGDQMEGKTDAAFNQIYKALQADLEKHGFDKNNATHIKDAYEKAKAERRNALLKKALQQL